MTDIPGILEIKASTSPTERLPVRGPGWTIELEGEQRSLYVERTVEGQEPELLRIDGMKIIAKIVIQVSEIRMQPRRLAEIDVSYAFGEGLIGDQQALIVVTEGENGSKLSVQFRKESNAKQGRSNFDHGSCYEQVLHEKTKQGRKWCRNHGPASKTKLPCGTWTVHRCHSDRRGEKPPMPAEMRSAH